MPCAGAVGDGYRGLWESVRESAVVHTDDTGWRVDGEGAFLIVFETEDATVSQVCGRRRSEEIREVVSGDYGGESMDYAGETERLRRALSLHLRDRPMPDRDNWRPENEPGGHDDRRNLLHFLGGLGIQPTNNRAERALRGAVIAREVSHCSRTEGGEDAFGAFTGAVKTLARKGGGQSVVDGLCGVFSAAPVHACST